VVLFMAGAGPVGEAVMPVVADTAMQGVFHVAGNAVGGTVATAVGDKALTEGASTGMGYLEARFRRLHVRFAGQRVEWMAKQLEEHLFGTLPEELRNSSLIAESAPYRDLQRVVQELQVMMTAVTDTP
jgi:thioesterase domain-containing protein